MGRKAERSGVSPLGKDRIQDRAPIDSFSVAKAEALIATLPRDWGAAQSNYAEFRFFTGLRPPEQIALLLSDCDLNAGTMKVTKARVSDRDKDRTKTNVDRIVDLCPRALQVLKRQLALRERLEAASCSARPTAIINHHSGTSAGRKR